MIATKKVAHKYEQLKLYHIYPDCLQKNQQQMLTINHRNQTQTHCANKSTEGKLLHVKKLCINIKFHAHCNFWKKHSLVTMLK